MTIYERRLFNESVYENEFKPRLKLSEKNKWVMVLDSKELTRLRKFCEKKVKAKNQESHGYDDENRIKREMTGACVEFAARKFYGISEDFDDSITFNSFEKDFPDFLPYAFCGVKGSYIGQVPLVKKIHKSYICQLTDSVFKGVKFRCADIMGITDHKTVWLLGIASPEILNTYVDDNLFITDSNGSKTGFYGASKLIDIPDTIENLQKITYKMLTSG